MNKTSQKKVIMNHLKRRNRITTMDAFSYYGITKLTTRISELRKSGVTIYDEWEQSANGARYKVYRLRPLKGGRNGKQPNARSRKVG